MIKRKLKKPILYKEIFKSLSLDLACEYKSELMIIAAHICDEDIEKDMHSALKVLFHYGFTIPQVLSALLNCESIRMQRLFAGVSSLTVNAQFKNLQQVIHHFNQIQDTVLQVGKDYLLQDQTRAKNEQQTLHADRIESEKVNDSIRQSILHDSLKHWHQTQEIKLYNFYQSIPVYANCSIIKIQGDYIDVQTSSDLTKVFASHSNHKQAYAICADDKEQVAVYVEQASKTSIKLKLGEVSQSLLNCRKNLGVRIDTKIPVKLTIRGESIKHAYLRDISSAGLGFSIMHMQALPCRTGEVIECKFKLNQKIIEASGWARWVVLANGQIRMGMELRPHVGIQQALQKEVFNIQRKIIVSLNELDIPDMFSNT